MATSFALKELFIDSDLSLFIDGNSKITAKNGTYQDPKPNAFSLPPVSTCPFSTQGCRKACYVTNLAKTAPEVFSRYVHNERVIHRILSSREVSDKAALALAEFIATECQGGFRWHVSGDIFSSTYAKWISRVCQLSPKVTHWIYTRSIVYADLLDADNLTVNLSCDSDNWAEVKAYWDTSKGKRLCYLTQDGTFPEELAEGSVIFPDYSLRGRELEDPTQHPWWQNLDPKFRKMVCPADFFGQSEKVRCGICKKCIK